MDKWYLLIVEWIESYQENEIAEDFAFVRKVSYIGMDIANQS